MGSSLGMIRIIGLLLITFLSAGYTTVSKPDPVNRGFVSVFDNKKTRADRYFNNFEYTSAIKLYNKLVKKGKADDEVKLRLAESYIKINDPLNAERWFAEVIHSDRITPQHQIQYAHTLLSNGKYEEARQVIDSYEFADSDHRSQAIINTLDNLQTFYADSIYYQLNAVEDNKPHYSDFSPTVYKNGIVFVSSRHDKGPKFKWDDSPFLDLYYTESDIAAAKPFSENLNSKYHEGPIAFYDNYTKAVFTRSNYLDKELGVTVEGINNLQLYTAAWNEKQNDWDQVKPVDFSTSNYSFGHPAISANYQRMYFISDMPGGYGGTDIYVSERTEVGWGEPRNMGEVINTPGNEMYPFIDNVDNLYFASNGHGGLGGLDVYQVNLNEGFDIRNMGYPLNTTADDFGFSFNANGKVAYISSNRDGADNIFQIEIKAPDLEMILADNSINMESPKIKESIEPLTIAELSTGNNYQDLSNPEELSTINASVISDNYQVLDDASLQLLVNGQESDLLMTDEDGKVSIQVPPDQEYTLIASKDGFQERSITIPAESLGQEEDLLIVMNTLFVDSEYRNQEIPTTELDPLAVTDDPWKDNSYDESDRPEIQGVALPELPGQPGDGNEEISTTELDPLAVTDDPWEDNSYDQSDRPEIQEVALSELPAQSDEGSEEITTTELDPLAVTDDGWEDNPFDESDRPEIQGVAINEFNGQNRKDNLESDDNEKGLLTASANPARNQEATTDQFMSSDESAEIRQLVDAVALNSKNGETLTDADIKLFVDSPNETLDYKQADGVLTFEILPEADYILVASHNDFQDQFVSISGEEILAAGLEQLDFELTPTEEIFLAGKADRRSAKLKAQVRDESTNELLEDAEVKLFVDGKAVESEYSKDNGKTLFKAPPGNDYMMLVSRDGYQDLIYHMPGAPEDNMDIDLAMLKSDDMESGNELLAIKERVFDENTGVDLNGITFKVYENGDLIGTTESLSSIQVDPKKNYKVLASKEGYRQRLLNLDLNILSNGPVDLSIPMQVQQISEATGAVIYDGATKEAIPFMTYVFDITNDQPLSEAVILVFEDDQMRNKLTTWNTGSVAINGIPGKNYQLVIQRQGYNDRIITVGAVEDVAADGIEIALIPSNVKRLKQSGIDLTGATIVVMSGPTGEEQLYLSTTDELYEYSVENDNHFLIKDGEKILLKERTRPMNSKVNAKQDSDQFNLRTEDQFLYDQLSADEKAMIDQIIAHAKSGTDLSETPELSAYYNNLPPEYRALLDYMTAAATKNARVDDQSNDLALSESLDHALAENGISISGVFDVNNIYYDFDKSSIREDAARELDKLVLIMKNNKNIKVSMFSHTDSRGSNAYNVGLSKRRGQAAVNYLVERGISIDRFNTEARGEAQLVNSCGDQIQCDEQAHQLNRRTEFTLSA